jgi:hypothetical protein
MESDLPGLWEAYKRVRTLAEVALETGVFVRLWISFIEITLPLPALNWLEPAWNS